MATVTVSPDILDKLFNDDVERYELVDGALIAKPMVSIFHSLIMGWLPVLLHQQLNREKLWLLVDPLSKIREDHWRRPDIAVIRAEDAEPWKYVMPGHWPILCVEIVSAPHQTVGELIEKCKLYHDQGVLYCWVIAPESQTAWTYHKGETPVWVSPLSGGELSAGEIRVKLVDLWDGLNGKRSNRTRDKD
jgi:Uma2 family endonuclease